MSQRQPLRKEPDQQVVRLINNLKRLGLSQTRAFRLPLLANIPLNTFQNWLLLYRNISPKWRAWLEDINNFLNLQPSPPALTMMRTDREIYRLVKDHLTLEQKERLFSGNYFFYRAELFKLATEYASQFEPKPVEGEQS